MSRATQIVFAAMLLTAAAVPLAATPAAAIACSVAQLVSDPTSCVPCVEEDDTCNTPCGGSVQQCADYAVDLVVDAITDLEEDVFALYYQSPHNPDVRPNGDGTYTITYEQCYDRDGDWCYERDAARVPPPGVPQTLNQLPRDPQVVRNADDSLTVTYRQCDGNGNNCQTRTLTATPAPCSPGNACATVNQLPRDPRVVDNDNATWTVNSSYCDGAGQNCERRNTTTTPDAVCFEHNPEALTNACFVFDEEADSVTPPEPTTDPRNVCIIGPVCVPVPVPGVEDGEPVVYYVPTVEGYFELTVICGTDVPCRVTV